MRLADAILRRGHLSEQCLVEAILTNDRPRHLDRCELCAERAVVLSRWLDDMRTTGLEMADAMFAPEQVKVQHDQILRRLGQLDQKPRVLTFPGLAALVPAGPMATRRVAPAWLGVAAAAGLVLGLIGGQLTARMGADGAAGPASAAFDTETAPGLPANVDPLSIDLEQRLPASLAEIDSVSPQLMASNAAGG